MAKDNLEIRFEVNKKQTEKALKVIADNIKGIKDNTEKANSSWQVFKGTLATLAVSKGIQLLTRAFSGFVGVIRSGIEAAQVQEDAINKLNAQLVISGSYTRQASQEMQKYASSLQKVTRFGDETIIGQLAFAKAMGASNDQAIRILGAATDMAEALNIDLNSAVRNVTKTLGGMKGELGELIPEMAALTREQLLNGAAIDIVAGKFKGSAAAAAKTYSGRVKQIKNAYGDLTEEIGILITNSDLINEVLKHGVGFFEDLSKVIKENRVAIRAFLVDGVAITIKGIQLLYQSVAGLVLAYKALNATLNEKGLKREKEELETKIRLDKKHIANLQAQLAATKSYNSHTRALIKSIRERVELQEQNEKSLVKVTEKLKLVTEEYNKEKKAIFAVDSAIDKLIEKIEKTTSVEQTESKKRIQNDKDEHKSKINAYKKRMAEQVAAAKVAADKEKEIKKQTFENFKSTLGNISVLMQSSNQEAFVIGKAAAVTQATIDGIAAVQVALKSAPVPFNFALAGLVGAATAFNVHKILAVPKPAFADGGVVPFGPGAVAGQDSVDASLTPGEIVFNEVQTATLKGGFDEAKMTAKEIRMLRTMFENGITLRNLNGEYIGEVYTQYIADGGIQPASVGRRR